MRDEKTFTQAEYNIVIGALDDVMTMMKDEFGKSEQQAQDWLKDFLVRHYFGVSRKMILD